ncbi:MAG TPA: rod shape-determining protein [Opitutaceae bacterium]|jgi:rod shape-determining protein MreB|nr:rod shape-determining protein [Opitutaceae bacterium]
MIAKSATKTPSSEGKSSETDTLLVGLDWGTNTSCLMAAPRSSSESRIALKEQIPTVVGYANENVLQRVLPNEAKVLFGTEALKHKLYLELVRPLQGGVIGDLPSSRLFAQHLRDRLNAGDREVRAVIGMPASSDMSAREDARAAVQGVFHKVLFVPEPFLAALGYRDESRLADTKYQDPVMNSLYVDIGAGSTDVCLVQGHYPTIDDQLSVPFAGDAVDQIILDGILAAYPDCGLTLARVREIKEKHSFVLAGDSSQPAIATVMVGGKARKLDVTDQVGAGCEALLQKVFELSRELIARADPDSVTELLQNVIVTGGGSLIKGFGVALQTKLVEEGFENPRVRVLGENYKDYVAKGALKAARQAKDRQWQNLIG